MPAELLTGRIVVPITRDTFPLNTPVIVRSFVDTNPGWEYDAPLHFMEPFHSYHIVSSIGDDVVDEILEEMLVDLQLRAVIEADADAWPYSPKYLKNLWRRAKRGEVQRLVIFESTVTVVSWGNEENDWDDYEWSVETVEIDAV